VAGQQSVDPRALEAAFSVDLHLAKLRARADHPGYREWAARRNALPLVPQWSEALPLDAAVRYIESLDRASVYRRHVAGSCALGVATAARSSSQNWARPALGTWLTAGSELVERSLIERLLSPTFDLLTPIGAYVAIAFEEAPCAVSNPVDGFSFDEYEVTTMSLDFDVNRSVGSLFKNFDPRMWDSDPEGSFAQADQISESDRELTIPGSANLPPPPALPDEGTEEASSGTSWSGLLYEDAVGAVGGLTVMEFRNFLRIDYAVDPSLINLEYHLSEGLSLDLGAGPIAGGLDRDCGVAVAQPNAVTGLTHVRASKSLRVVQPPNDRDVLNCNMAAMLPLWFMHLCLLGVCKNFD